MNSGFNNWASRSQRKSRNEIKVELVTSFSLKATERRRFMRFVNYFSNWNSPGGEKQKTNWINEVNYTENEVQRKVCKRKLRDNNSTSHESCFSPLRAQNYFLSIKCDVICTEYGLTQPRSIATEIFYQNVQNKVFIKEINQRTLQSKVNKVVWGSPLEIFLFTGPKPEGERLRKASGLATIVISKDKPSSKLRVIRRPKRNQCSVFYVLFFYLRQ